MIAVACTSSASAQVGSPRDAPADPLPTGAQGPEEAPPTGPLFGEPSADRLRGLVSPSQQVVLGAPLDSVLAEVMVEEGAHVKADQVVARMDDDAQRVQVELAKLEIERRKMMLEEAEIQLDRMVELEKTSSAQGWEVRRSRLARDQAEVALESARRSLQLQKETLERYRVRAPFAGQVVRQSTDAGASLRHGEPILSMLAMDPLEAQIHLPVELYGELEVGRNYPLKIGRAYSQISQRVGSDRLMGKLKMVEPVVDSASQSFRAVFTIENPDHKLPAGFAVRLIRDDQSSRVGARR